MPSLVVSSCWPITHVTQVSKHIPYKAHLACGRSYVDRASRVTFHYDGQRIVMRNNCNHDIIKRSP